MSTIDIIDPKKAPERISEMKAMAVTLMYSQRVLRPTMDELYELAKQQPTVIETDVPMAGQESLGLKDKNILVSFTGEDSGRSAWARRILPMMDEVRSSFEKANERVRYNRMLREVSYELMQRELIKVNAYFSKSSDFMGKMEFLVPKEFAKLGLDFAINFIPVTDETRKIYEKSKQINETGIRIVCYPDWINDEWLFWKSRNPAGRQNPEDPEPPRIMMLFDVENYTAFLLGARYFGEVKKAALSLIWDMAIWTGTGMPIHGSSKTITTVKKDKKTATTFISLGLSGTGKSTLGNDPHKESLDYENGEGVHIGNDDALVILADPSSKKKGIVGLESNCYNKSNDYSIDSFYYNTVMTAENIMVAKDENGKRMLIHEDVRNPNGRVESYRLGFEGTDEVYDTPWPDYMVLIMRDEILPPVTLIKDPDLLISMYLSLATRTSAAENVTLKEIGKLRFIPGANPFNLWGIKKEIEMLESVFNKIKFKALVLNTGGFFKDWESHTNNEYLKISKELSLSIFPKVAKGEIKWHEWSATPGMFYPDKASFKDVVEDYDKFFTPSKIKDQAGYSRLRKERIEQRLDFLKSIGAPYKYIAPLNKILGNIEL